MGNSWKDLVVWQKGHDMVLDIYKLIKDFPRIEAYSIVDQIKRAAYSVPANIEGHSKKSKKRILQVFIHFQRLPGGIKILPFTCERFRLYKQRKVQ